MKEQLFIILARLKPRSVLKARQDPCLTVQEVKHKRISSITAMIILIVNNIFNNDIITWILPINCDVIYPTRSASSNISLSLIIFRHWQVPEGSRQLDFQLTTRVMLTISVVIDIDWFIDQLDWWMPAVWFTKMLKLVLKCKNVISSNIEIADPPPSFVEEFSIKVSVCPDLWFLTAQGESQFSLFKEPHVLIFRCISWEGLNGPIKSENWSGVFFLKCVFGTNKVVAWRLRSFLYIWPSVYICSL